MKLPKNWTQVTVNQWREIQLINPAEFDSVFLQSVEILSILSDTDPEEFEELEPDEIIKLLDEVAFIRREPSNKPKQVLSDFVLKPLDALTLGEFIDLEYYISQTALYFREVLSILYKKTDFDKWGNVEFEPYVYKLENRIHEFNEVPITDVYGAVSKYIEYSNEFKTRYENLFNPVIDEPEELDPEDAKAEAEEKVYNKWSWEKLLYDLANNDITKIDEITNLPLIFVFNMLSMVEELNLNKD